jgi:hypothetical protein
MSGPASAARKGQRNGKSGSHFSDRQIAQAVKDGKPLRVAFPDGESIEGWVYGADDYHWGIVDAGGTTHLIHKSAPRVTVLDHYYSDLPEVVEKIAGPFRDWVMREHFNSQTAAAL